MRAIYDNYYRSYWSTTSAYDSVKTYIQMNFDGLKDDIIRMLSGEHVHVNTLKFQNDMHIVNSRNDVLQSADEAPRILEDFHGDDSRLP
ncbi:MAG: hypothetical protein ACI3X9_00300 [Bacteroidaceae bacterium]